VVVRNAAGDSLPAKLTSWAVTAGGGQLPFGAEVLTNAAGEAGNIYVVGPNPGANTVEVTVTGNPTVKTSFSATATAPPATASVNVTDNQFVPDEVQIATGGKVTWTWAGSNDHNVIWVSGGFANSGTQSSGSHEVIFGASGSYDYYCSIHGSPSSGMRGKVEVKD
jgi:plastocyanin